MYLYVTSTSNVLLSTHLRDDLNARRGSLIEVFHQFLHDRNPEIILKISNIDFLALFPCVPPEDTAYTLQSFS